MPAAFLLKILKPKGYALLPLLLTLLPLLLPLFPLDILLRLLEQVV